MTEAAVDTVDADRNVRAEADAMAGVFATLAAVFARPPDLGTAAAVARLAASLGVTCPVDVPLDALARDYAALFAVPGARYVAPYESVYLDAVDLPVPTAATSRSAPRDGSATQGRARRGLLMGPSTLEVGRAQLESGLAVDRDLPDHLANELWFVAHLWRKQAAAEGDETDWAARRERFIREHLGRWLGDLLVEVRRNEECAVYGAALQVVQQVIDLD